jgi:hypothetical protein
MYDIRFQDALEPALRHSLRTLLADKYDSRLKIASAYSLSNPTQAMRFYGGKGGFTV